MNEKQENRSYILRHKDYYSKRAGMWLEAANNTESTIRYYLFAFVIFLFTFSPVGVLKETDGNAYSNLWLILFVWFLLILSLIFGVVHIVNDLKFFILNKNIANTIEGLWANTNAEEDNITKTYEKSAKLNNKAPSSTSSWPLFLQALFASLGFLLILIGHITHTF